MNRKQLAALLDKYAKGTCTSEEVAIIHKWYSVYHSEKAILDGVSDKKKEFIKSRMLNEIFGKINEQEVLTPEPWFASLWFRISTAAILLIALSIGFRIIHTDKDAIRQSRIVNNTRNIMKQVLPDQSIVWLNPNSSITFPEKFNGPSRDLEMVGECFFEITKNPERPFIIQSKHLVTKVWGTKFKVSDKEDASTAEVAVLSGKVSVSVQGSKASRAGAELVDGEIVLNPKQKVLFEPESQTIKANRHADISQLKIYEHASLLFENTSLEEIALALNSKFGVKVIIKDKSLRRKILNADLTNLNLPEILEVLKTTLQLNYEIHDQQIILINQ